MKVIRDARDGPLVRVILKATLLAGFGTLLILSDHYAGFSGRPGIAWTVLAALYAFLFVKVLGPFVLMEHILVHRKTFTPKYEWLEVVVMVVNPFFGQTYQSYGAHHVGMHHYEENGASDLSSTRNYQRDSVADFIRYFFRFFFVGLFELPIYLSGRKQWRQAGKLVVGEIAYLLLLGVALAIHPLGATLVFVLPLVAVRFAMISGNWAQHSFIDPNRDAKPPFFSITCVETPYNDLCFNDGYHIQHHEKPSAHWADLPVLFEASREKLLREGAVIFRGIDYFGIWWKLMRKDYDGLGERLWATPEGLRGAKPADFIRTRIARID